MTAPHCIRPDSITIIASIAACIGCWCVATVPTERLCGDTVPLTGSTIALEALQLVSTLVRRRPASLEHRLDATVACPDHIGRHRAHESVEGLVSDRIDHPLADQLGIDAGPRQALRQNRLGSRMQL